MQRGFYLRQLQRSVTATKRPFRIVFIYERGRWSVMIKKQTQDLRLMKPMDRNQGWWAWIWTHRWTSKHDESDIYIYFFFFLLLRFALPFLFFQTYVADSWWNGNGKDLAEDSLNTWWNEKKRNWFFFFFFYRSLVEYSSGSSKSSRYDADIGRALMARNLLRLMALFFLF